MVIAMEAKAVRDYGEYWLPDRELLYALARCIIDPQGDRSKIRSEGVHTLTLSVCGVRRG